MNITSTVGRWEMMPLEPFADGHKPPTPDRSFEEIAKDQRLLEECSEGIGKQFAKDAADAIERLIWERGAAIRWANVSVKSVQDALFPCRDALAALVGKSTDLDGNCSAEWLAALKALEVK